MLEGERPQTLNKYFGRAHWAARQRENERAGYLVREQIDPDQALLYGRPVHITLRAYFDHHPIDPDNIASKPYIDALIGWYLYDDNLDWVCAVTKQSFVDPDNPRLEIELEECHVQA